MRISAITAGVISCGLVFVIADAKASAIAPTQMVFEESPTLMQDLTTLPVNEVATATDITEQKPVQNNNQDNSGEASKETKPEEKKPANKPEVVKYTVEDGDSLSIVAKKYDTTWKRLFDKNTKIQDPDVINPGDKLVIPHKDEKLESRELPEPVVEQEPVRQSVAPKPATAAPKPVAKANCDEQTQWVRADNGQCLDKPGTGRRSSRQTSSPRKTTTRKSSRAPVRQVSHGPTAGNLYSYGYCTWYVKNRRPDLPNNLGNANTWLSRAAAQGYSTGYSPRAGAVAYALTGYMHVAYVERVNANGTVTVSEMNFRGWNVRSTRTVPAGQFAYIYR